MNSIYEVYQALSMIERVLVFLVLAPFAGGLLAGVDRKLSARLQGRYGPPVRQPFFDVLKLFQKERILVNKFQNFNIVLFFLFTVFSGAIFFAGADILLAVFGLALAGTFFILAGFSVGSPYSHLGAEREVIQMVSYEPMVILMAVGMYQVTGSFKVADLVQHQAPLILYLPGIFAGFLYILTIKFRKSPFDLSMSHHAHQEIVRGITTEFSGPALALIEITHWYENVLLLGMVYLFFGFNPWIALAVSLATYLFEIFIDMNYARFKWQLTFASTWLFTAVAGISNIVVLSIMK
ncbi:MAG: Hydrogenase-4 component C [Syntrophorhabdus sp. PtaU1.Bin002]|nr:MAG: Hydrogenase-4 component C [Syntrophorhabdus sp. PtaB.Bin006]OPY69320.1 MAG: Hydrogenase-4 component C [Syntrophorhabdus sp. PtaU1.Bin002]